MTGTLAGLRAARHLEDGRAQLARARTLVLEGDAEGAADAFERARAELHRAVAEANAPALDAIGVLPLAGRTPDALRHLAAAAEEVARAGVLASDELAAMPGGLAALAIEHGTVPLGALERLAPTMARVRAMVEDARERTELAATTLVPDRVAQAVYDARDQLGALASTVRGVDEVVRALPAFAGANGTRRYLVAAQTPAELRGTGGFIGSYSILTMDRGAMRLAPFRSIHLLPDLPPGSEPTWPSPAVESAFSPYASASVWAMANVTPDAPTAASLLTQLWRRSGGPPLDGVVLVDVQALPFLLAPVGAIEVLGADAPITADDVVPFLTAEVYDDYPDNADRKDFLGRVGHEVLRRFLADAGGVEAIRALVAAVAGGHLAVVPSDPGELAAFRAAGAAGGLRAPDGRTVATVINNLGATKLDVYLHETVSYDVSLLPDGRASVRAAVTLENDAPVDARPGLVVGPSDDPGLAAFDLAPGETLLGVSVYCGPGCRLVSTGSDEGAPAVRTDAVYGLTMASTTLRIEPGGSRTLRMRFEVEDAWEGDDASGRFALEARGQPLLNPASASITVRVPDGTGIAWVGEGIGVDGDVASWGGELGAGREVEVRFDRGLLGPLWAAFGR